jgi:hypothetical protein
MCRCFEERIDGDTELLKTKHIAVLLIADTIDCCRLTPRTPDLETTSISDYAAADSGDVGSSVASLCSEAAMPQICG